MADTAKFELELESGKFTAGAKKASAETKKLTAQLKAAEIEVASGEKAAQAQRSIRRKTQQVETAKLAKHETATQAKALKESAALERKFATERRAGEKLARKQRLLDLRHFEKEEKAQKKASESGGGWKEVFKGNLATRAFDGALGVAGATADATYEMIKFGEQSRMAFGQLAKHGASPEKLFQRVRDISKEFGLDLVDTTHTYQKFLALQFNPAEAEKMLKMGADLRVLGNSAEDVKGVFLAIGQIKSKGRLQGEEMLQLQERGVSGALVKEAIAKRMGVDYGQVDKLQAAGKISADVGLAAIEDAIKAKLGENELGEAGKRFAEQTVEGMVGKMQALGADIGVKLTDKLAPHLNRAMTSLSSRLGKFFDSDKGEQFLTKVGNAIGYIADKVADAVVWMASDEGMKFFEGIANAASEAWTFVKGLFIETDTGQGKFSEFFQGEASLLLGFITGDTERMRGAAMAMGKAIASGVSEGIMAGLPDSVQAVLGLSDAIKGAFTGKEGIDSHSPSKVFESYGEYSADGYAQGLEGKMGSTRLPFVQDAAVGMMGPARPASSSTGAAIGGGMGAVTFAPVINVNGAGGDSGETARAVETSVRRQFSAFLQQLTMEAAVG